MRMRCPACGRRLHTVHVHSHGQCAFCATPIEPCCEGAGDEADARPWGPPLAVDPAVLKQVFLGLGGTCATVTEEALLHALSARFGGTWDEARATLESLLQAGLLLPGGEELYRLGKLRSRRRRSQRRE